MAGDDHTVPRQFRCQEQLWRTFEQMSEELEKSVDELINDALTAYAQLAGYDTETETETETGAERLTPPPPPPQPVGVTGQLRPPVPPAPPMPSRFGRPTPMASPSLVAAGLTPPPPPVEVPANGATLYLVFDNQKYRIDKDQFIIGRGSKSSDLPIKDGNISRKHAAIIRRNGTYFIKDLGSTNGIDFKGMRIDNKRIDEGDVFHLCEYELRFTYKR
jgi:hypothetical protein